MTQNITWGFPFAVQGSLYGGTAPYLAESAATGSNGLGARMGARLFKNDPSQLFVNAGSADVIAFNRGVRLVTSISNPTFGSANYASALPGGSAQVANDAAYNAFFTRIKPSGGNLLKYSTAVDTTGANLLGSYGGINWPNFELIIEHEVDRPDKHVVAADFIAYWKHIYGLAVAAGVKQYITFNWCVTVNDGIRTNRVEPFFPGTAFVDVIGLDYYSDFNASWAYDGSTLPFATGFAQSLTYVRSKGLPFNCPEFSEAESGNDTDMQNWFTGIATTLNAATDVTCTGIYMWSQASSAFQNANKTAGQDPATGTAHLGKHNGIAAAMAATGGNAVLTGTSQGFPSPATGVAATSAADGKSATGTWANPPVGDNVTSWDWYLGVGNTTSLVKQNTTPLAAATRSVTIPNLKPSTQYSFDVVPINSAGRAGFGVIAPLTTATPGVVNHAPNIAGFTAVPQAANPFAVDFNITASDPDGNPITITIVVTSPAIPGGSETFSMSSGLQATRTYQAGGAFTATASVSDGTLTTTATISFGVNLLSIVTKGQGWGIGGIQPGTDPRGVGQTMLGIVNSLDTSVTNLLSATSATNALHGMVGSSYDPIFAVTYTTLGSGWLMWSGLVLQGSSFTRLLTITGASGQTGTGVHIGLHDAAGNVLVDEQGNLSDYSGTAVDSWLVTANIASILTLPSPVLNRNYGEILYVSIYCPAGMAAYPTVSTSSGLNAALGSVNTSAGHPRWGRTTGATGIPSTLPFGSASFTNGYLFMGLLP